MKNPFTTLRAWVVHKEYAPLVDNESTILGRLANLESRMLLLERFSLNASPWFE